MTEAARRSKEFWSMPRNMHRKDISGPGSIIVHKSVTIGKVALWHHGSVGIHQPTSLV
jgi:hypothetical protein